MNLLDELKVYFPKYEVVLPVSKLKVVFTPFKVKDAKNLSIILQENNKKLEVSVNINFFKFLFYF